MTEHGFDVPEVKEMLDSQIAKNILDGYVGGYRNGIAGERKRILQLLDSFWCGEPACEKHPVRMDWVIDAIKKENK